MELSQSANCLKMTTNFSILTYPVSDKLGFQWKLSIQRNARNVRNARARKYARNYVANVAALIIIHNPLRFLGRLLLQFNAAQQNESSSSVTNKVNEQKQITINAIFKKQTNAQLFNINYKRRSVKGAVACLIGRCVRSVSCVTSVTSVALCTLRALLWCIGFRSIIRIYYAADRIGRITGFTRPSVRLSVCPCCAGF